MPMKKTACLVFLFFLLCTFFFPDVQAGWLSSRRRRASSHSYAWQKGRTMSRTYSGWDTSFNTAFKWTCSGSRESISQIASAHEYYHEDRVWKFNCQSDNNINSSCSWSEHRVNKLDRSFSYICPKNGHIVGMDGSAFNGHNKDREFNFKCCDTASHTYCKWTSYFNDWDGDMDYDLPCGYFVAGVSSYHDNRYEDRRWKFYICL